MRTIWVGLFVALGALTSLTAWGANAEAEQELVRAAQVAQQDIHALLADGTTSSDAAAAVYTRIDTFVRNYARALRNDDPSTRELTFEAYCDAKVGPALDEHGASFLRSDLQSLAKIWIDTELARPEAR
jgi:HAMP domain-containing protein